MKRYLAPSLIAISVFLTCVGTLFIQDRSTFNWAIVTVGIVYAVVCFIFLLFQLYAFTQAHLNYHEEVEGIKYQVFDAEGVREE